MAAKTPQSGDNQGPAIDATGSPVDNPTRNVLELVAAAVARQDDLRRAAEKLADTNTEHTHAMSQLRSDHLLRITDIEARHARERMEQEANRIDAIRAVDVQAVQRAAEVAATALATLATTAATTQETLRTQVATTAAASAAAFTASLEPIQKTIDELRRFQFEQLGGKAQTAEARGEKGVSIQAFAAGIAAVIALVAVAGIIVTIILAKP